MVRSLNRQGSAGADVIIRNQEGEVILTAWKISGRSALKRRPLRRASDWLSQWCPGPVIVESNSARIVMATTNHSDDRSEIRGTVMEVRAYLQLPVEWKLQKVKREGNKVAYELTHLARRNTRYACVLDLRPFV